MNEKDKTKYFCSECKKEIKDPDKNVNGRIIIFRCPLCKEELGRRLK